MHKSPYIQEAFALADRRYTPGKTEAGVTAEILAAVERGRARSRAVEIATQVIPGCPAFRCNLDNPHVCRLFDLFNLTKELIYYLSA